MIEIIDCAQNSPAWIRARLGIITASNFGTVMANGKDGGESITRRKLLCRLAGERITGIPTENYSNKYMERGHAMEDGLRNHYAFLCDVEPERVGFVRNGQIGCSPDSLLSKNGVLEIKSVAPDILIELILKDSFPPKFKAQTQGQVKCTEREYVDIICGYTGMQPLIKRAYRDSFYIKKLSDALDQFNDELLELVEKLRMYSPSIPAHERAA